MWLPNEPKRTTLWLPRLWLPIGPWRFLPCPICCDECPCDGTAPNQWTVVFDGVSGEGCSTANCQTDWHNPFVLDPKDKGTWSTASCAWNYTMPDTELLCYGGGFTYEIRLYLLKISTDYYLDVEMAILDNPASVKFRKYFSTTKPACSQTDLDVPFDSDSDSLCDWTGATCTVTSS